MFGFVQSAERASREGQVLNYAAGDQVLLDDALQGLRRGGMVPDAFGIDHGDGTLFADAQAIGLGPVDAVEQAQLGQTALEILPGFAGRLPGNST